MGNPLITDDKRLVINIDRFTADIMVHINALLTISQHLNLSSSMYILDAALTLPQTSQVILSYPGNIFQLGLGVRDQINIASRSMIVSNPTLDDGSVQIVSEAAVVIGAPITVIASGPKSFQFEMESYFGYVTCSLN